MIRGTRFFLLLLPVASLGFGPIVSYQATARGLEGWYRGFNHFFWGHHPAPNDFVTAIFGLNKERFDSLVLSAVEDASRCVARGAWVFVSLEGRSNLPGDTRVKHLWTSLRSALGAQGFFVAETKSHKADYRLEWALLGEPSGDDGYRFALKIELISLNGSVDACVGRSELQLWPDGDDGVAAKTR